MSLTFGPKHFDVSPTSPSQVSVYSLPSMTPAVLDSAVALLPDGSITFSVINAGHYQVVISAGQVSIAQKIYLTSITPYDITDARSYANSAPQVAGGSTRINSDETGSMVTSVAGRRGDVVLDRSDVGLPFVNNTLDENKPISIATQNALNTLTGRVGTSENSLAATQTTVTALQSTILSLSNTIGTTNATVTSHTGALADHTSRIGVLETTAITQVTPTLITGSTAIGRQVLTATDATAVRNAIGAGTSSLILGTASTAAKPGNYFPIVNDITDATTVGRNLLRSIDAATARGYIEAVDIATVDARVQSIIDSAPGALDTLNEIAAALGEDENFAGTITAELATKAEDVEVVKLAGAQTITGAKTFTAIPGVPDASFAISKIVNLQTTLDGKALLSHSHAASGISDATSIGRTILTAADAAAVRTAIGAGTSTLALGTSSTTAAQGDTVVTLSGNQTINGTKTYNTAPVVPNNSFTSAKITNFITDVNSTIAAYNIANPITSSSLPDFSEAVDDRISSLVVAGSGISIVYNDASNTLTFTSSGTPNSGDAFLLNRTNHTGAQAQSTVTNLVSDLSARALKSSIEGLVVKNEGAGTWSARPTGYAAVVFRGSEPGPVDMVAGDVREILV